MTYITGMTVPFFCVLKDHVKVLYDLFQENVETSGISIVFIQMGREGRRKGGKSFQSLQSLGNFL
jgi:hypothetical protein